MIGHENVEAGGVCRVQVSANVISGLSVGHRVGPLRCHVRISLFVCGVELGWARWGSFRGEKAGEGPGEGGEAGETRRQGRLSPAFMVRDLDSTLTVSHINRALGRELLLRNSRITHMINLRNVQSGATTLISGTAPSLRCSPTLGLGVWLQGSPITQRVARGSRKMPPI